MKRPDTVTPTTQNTDREEYARFLKALGARIRSMRRERGWTYRDMVQQHDYHLASWQGFESGKAGMALPSLLRIAKTFGMHPSELIAGLPAASMQTSADYELEADARHNAKTAVPEDEQS